MNNEIMKRMEKKGAVKSYVVDAIKNIPAPVVHVEAPVINVAPSRAAEQKPPVINLEPVITVNQREAPTYEFTVVRGDKGLIERIIAKPMVEGNA